MRLPLNNNATLTFHVNILMQRIETNAYILADNSAGLTDETKAAIKDIGQEENLVLTMQKVSMAYQECIELLAGIDKRASSNPYGDDDDDSAKKNVLTIHMRIPRSFPSTEIHTLQRNCEEYIVSRVLEEWLLVVAPALYPMWQSKAESCVQKIRHAMTVRMTPVHRSCHPF